MKLLTKQEAEKLVRQSSVVASVPATTTAIQAALTDNKNAVVLLLKK